MNYIDYEQAEPDLFRQTLLCDAFSAADVCATRGFYCAVETIKKAGMDLDPKDLLPFLDPMKQVKVMVNGQMNIDRDQSTVEEALRRYDEELHRQTRYAITRALDKKRQTA